MPARRSRPLVTGILLTALLLPVVGHPAGPNPRGEVSLPAGENVIRQASPALAGFAEALARLRRGERRRVVVLHVGDSHVQADLFTGVLRRGLQQRYGDAGRGFVFPHRAARTTEPLDYRSSAVGRWEARRNVLATPPIPVGVGGISLETRAPLAAVTLSLEGEDGTPFDSLVLFHQKGKEFYDFILQDQGGGLLAYVSSFADQVEPWTSRALFPEPRRQITIRAVQTGTSQKAARLYGLVLERDAPGVLYHAVGVNGATFRDYNLSAHFLPQAALLAPDLVVVSLGTNEASSRKFDPVEVDQAMRTLLGSLRGALPGASFLLTSPPDTYRLRKYVNQATAQVAGLEERYCREEGLAFWDFFRLMGGTGAMEKWKKAGLAQKDMVHFTREGYALQGRLLLEALLAAVGAGQGAAGGE
jgi:lysophospholipase L1-like esterase